MSGIIFSRKVLIAISLSLFSLCTFAAQPADKFSCVKLNSFKIIKGSGTQEKPYIIPLNTCIQLDGNQNQEYVFKLTFTKKDFQNGDRLQFTATSYTTQSCEKEKLYCLDHNNAPNLSATPMPDDHAISVKLGYFTNITHMSLT